MYRKPHATQKAKHRAADGHVHRSPEPHDPHRREALPAVMLKDTPTGNHMPAEFGDRMGHRAVKRLSNITVERTRLNPNSLAKRMTKFIGNVTGQVRIPRNLLSKNREAASSQAQGPRKIDVGECMPED